MIKEIASNGTLFALIADAADVAPGIHPLTDGALPLQALMRRHPAGHEVANHMHRPVVKSTNGINEGIVVISGALSVTISDREGKDLGTHTVSSGQCLLMLEGAHHLTMTEDIVFFEFKNGPYVDDKIML